jgi:protease-4
VVLLVVFLGGSILLNMILAGAVAVSSFESDNKVQEKFHSHNANGIDKVAIISVEGAILDGEGFVKRQIDRAQEDTHVKAVVVRVVSPGGTVSGSDYLYHHLRLLAEKRKIPVVVSMGGIAASGGYYLSMAVGDTPESIFAEPTTWTGSIGVVIPHYNLVDLMQHVGIADDSIASHRLKTMGSFTKPMTEEERKIFQALIDDSFGRFKEIIRSGRPKFRKDPAALDKLATGQVFSADEALRVGLVDKIGFIDDAIDRAIQLAKLDSAEVRVVKYKPEVSLAALLSGADSRAAAVDPAALLQRMSPQGYYLYSVLPTLFSSGRRGDGN